MAVSFPFKGSCR